MFFKIGGWLVYSVVFVSATQQHESALSMCMGPPSSAAPAPPDPTRLGCHREVEIQLDDSSEEEDVSV